MVERGWTFVEMTEILRRMAKNSSDLGGRHIVQLPSPPSPLEFLRLVRASSPALIQGCLKDHQDQLALWKKRSYLESRLKKVPVSITPNGLADAVVDNCFVLPYEAMMDVSEFLDCMQDVPQQPDHTTWQDGQKPSNGPVYYLQSQNDNFHSAEFEELLKDIPNAIDFASAALDKPPDAVNFWLGNSRSTTSFHRDPYENIYHVVAGTKRFLLVPPLESFMMNEHPFPTAQYIPQIKDGVGIQESEWIIEPTISAQPTPWCQLNPKSLFRNAKPIIVDVSAGETLYLPSLWYHSVLQVDEKMDGFSGTIAVNWWYDMDYTPFSVAIETVKRLGRILEYGSDWQTKSVSDGSDSDT